MSQFINLEGIATAIIIATIFAFVKLFRDVDQLKSAQRYEIDALKSEVEDVVTWYKKTSMDALKIAANPTSKRLTELANKYIDTVNGSGQITTAEKQELIDGLREIMNDPKQYASKRQSASMSLRFIETREGLTSHAASNSTNH